MGEIACSKCRHVRNAHEGLNAPGCALCVCASFEVDAANFNANASGRTALGDSHAELLAVAERALAQLLEVNPHPVRTIEALRTAIKNAKAL